MIIFKNVSKRYPDGYIALNNIDFTVESGEMVFLTGHSGAGKSTLLKLIAAIERPTSGTITLSGQNIAQLKLGAIPYLRRKIGFIFQDHKLLFDRNVFDNVLLPLQISNFDSKTIAGRVRAALDKVGLLKKEKAMPIALSGGERQRLCIARAVVHRPSILIADEPTGNLDIEYAQDIMSMFTSFNQVGVTVLIATHDASLLRDTEHRILSLKQGKLAV
ncbi:MAG: cell division ATP-binding protein FtsE [Nitrosomonas sp.]|jgi:cell division transport system ATP-binding protein|uniref:cell division ATP-binding protein FtsE n=1 Tax=Nitrosomonas sp. TaxID=42353 RepID=UPI002717C6B6|nr:cell division ATP-binding protein FtsE [Nitrosomonas sp.]MDO8894860.1 cell division ATP-binding protein FtsE [Nitrosomonas sp.]MDP1550777.1 cell division ATP-binding protein FtsE [Nitrosomonas sp.]MDP3282278.1 cell division ATP-binding protein FtsE [Nitrosomonas sp.]MDP3664461.1 cell division ATP-binding protein FtsE [Nitrosomonas sp.]MDZ4104744.1 cell division ATP-binding protein FtsE [Nitrosomonas sp.]